LGIIQIETPSPYGVSGYNSEKELPMYPEEVLNEFNNSNIFV
jgi:hypothetical protein